MDILGFPKVPMDTSIPSIGKSMRMVFTDMESENSFVAGDFNCHLNPTLDKLPPGSVPVYFSFFRVFIHIGQ